MYRLILQKYHEKRIYRRINDLRVNFHANSVRKVVILELFNCCWSIIMVIFAIALELIDLSLSHTLLVGQIFANHFGAFLLKNSVF